MFWILTILVCVASAEKCHVSSEAGKRVMPNVSVKRGATFLTNSYEEVAEQCHKGCCSSTRCDTSFYTGTKFDKRGDNCFYFDCDGHCVFSNSTSNETEDFSVFVVNRAAPAHVELPDFAAMFTSTVPKEDRPTHSEKESEIKTSNDTETTATLKPDAPAKNQTATETVKPDAPAKNQTAAVTVKPDAPAKNQTNEIEGTPASSHSNTDQVTVKDHADKPDTSKTNATKDKTNSGEDIPQQPSDTKSTETKPEEKVKQTPTHPAHKVSLPNEVPVVKVHTEPGKTDTEDTHESEQSEEENEVKEQSDAAAEGPEEVNMSNKTLSISTTNKVVIDVNSEEYVHEEGTGGGYTKKDVVFWVAVVVGSSLVVFGLVMLVRVYRNKRRRLYSSLTDDYLINGMYSI